MVIQPERLLGHDFGERRQSHGPRDAILYALGAGVGCDPVAPAAACSMTAL
jgi:hypothetical protein